MNSILYPAISLLALLVAVMALVSRHHLRTRHDAAKKTLTRVAHERDELRWSQLQASDGKEPK